MPTRRRRIGLAIANSPLVKTAIAGGDANWGRVIMAVGKSGEPVEMGRLGVAFGGHDVARDGAAVPDLDEAPVAAHLAGSEIAIGSWSAMAREPPPSGPAISPTATSRSMPTTDPEPDRVLLVVACALVDADGRVLVAQRPAGKPMAGLWEFPGGKLHAARPPRPA